MAKIITSDFKSIQDALNKMIIGEVKAALRLVPGQMIEADGPVPLCRIVVSLVSDYKPYNLAVRSVFLRDDNTLSFVAPIPDSDNEWHANDEDADWLNITDFQYLIEQLKDKMPDGKYDLTNGADLHELDSKAHNKIIY